MDKVVLLIDGDILSYRASAVIEKRTVLASDLEGNDLGEYPTRTAFKEEILKSGEYDKTRYLFQDIQTAEPKENAFHVMKSQLTKFRETFWPDAVKIFVSGKNNFRDTLELPTKYKGHRTSMIRPVHLKECKKYLWKNHDAIVSDNAEADDYLIWNGYEYLKKGYTPIILSNDKDSLAYTGLSVFDFTKEDSEVLTVPDFGSLRETPQGIKGDGFIWLCFQWLYGDDSDCYRASELANVRFGEKSAYKLLKDTTSKQEALEAVINQYKAWYPEPFQYTAWDGRIIDSDYKHMLQLYLRCAKMKTYRNDSIDLERFLKKKGVSLC